MTAGKNNAGSNSSSRSQQNMFEGPETEKKKRAQKGKKGSVHLKGSRSLERLRNRIELAVNELHRLREENLELQRQLDQFRSHNVDELDGTAIVFTESPALLKAKVTSLIATIDRHLEYQQDHADSSVPEGNE